MYKLYTDKQEVFECNIELHGASLSKSQARLVVESEDLTLLFKGTISKEGKCTIPVKKLKGLLEESSKGTITLEVIADDVYFRPWQSEFAIEAARKVTVEVVSQQKQTISESSKPSIKVDKVSQQPTKKEVDHAVRILKLLVREDIKLGNLVVRKDRVNKIVATYLRLNKIDETQTPKIIQSIIQKLS